MRLLKWGTLSILRSIDSHDLFSDVLVCFPLIYFFTLDHFGWWFEEISSIDLGFFVLSKQSGVEYIVNFPCFRQFQLIGDWSDDFGNFEWSFPSLFDLFVMIHF